MVFSNQGRARGGRLMNAGEGKGFRYLLACELKIAQLTNFEKIANMTAKTRSIRGITVSEDAYTREKRKKTKWALVWRWHLGVGVGGVGWLAYSQYYHPPVMRACLARYKSC